MSKQVIVNRIYVFDVDDFAESFSWMKEASAAQLKGWFTEASYDQYEHDPDVETVTIINV